MLCLKLTGDDMWRWKAFLCRARGRRSVFPLWDADVSLLYFQLTTCNQIPSTSFSLHTVKLLPSYVLTIVLDRFQDNIKLNCIMLYKSIDLGSTIHMQKNHEIQLYISTSVQIAQLNDPLCLEELSIENIRRQDVWVSWGSNSTIQINISVRMQTSLATKVSIPGTLRAISELLTLPSVCSLQPVYVECILTCLGMVCLWPRCYAAWKTSPK